jgi:hypothetical protein
MRIVTRGLSRLTVGSGVGIAASLAGRTGSPLAAIKSQVVTRGGHVSSETGDASASLSGKDCFGFRLWVASMKMVRSIFSVFSLLLAFTSVLGFAFQSDPAFQKRVLDSTLRLMPVIGPQISGHIGSLTGSGVALAVGLLGAVWTGLGVYAGDRQRARPHLGRRCPRAARVCEVPGSGPRSAPCVDLVVASHRDRSAALGRARGRIWPEAVVSRAAAASLRVPDIRECRSWLGTRGAAGS